MCCNLSSINGIIKKLKPLLANQIMCYILSYLYITGTRSHVYVCTHSDESLIRPDENAQVLNNLPKSWPYYFAYELYLKKTIVRHLQNFCDFHQGNPNAFLGFLRLEPPDQRLVSRSVN